MCLNNEFDKILKNYKMRCTNNKIDKKLKNEVILWFDFIKIRFYIEIKS